MVRYVKWFNKIKDLNFVRTTDEDEVFITYSNVRTTSNKGIYAKDSDVFDLIKTSKGIPNHNVVSLFNHLI